MLSGRLVEKSNSWMQKEKEKENDSAQTKSLFVKRQVGVKDQKNSKRHSGWKVERAFSTLPVSPNVSRLFGFVAVTWNVDPSKRALWCRDQPEVTRSEIRWIRWLVDDFSLSKGSIVPRGNRGKGKRCITYYLTVISECCIYSKRQQQKHSKAEELNVCI